VTAKKPCPLHHRERAKAIDADRRKNDPTYALYHSTRWANFREWFLKQNVICQRIVDGVPCERIAKLIHHRISPRQDHALMFDATNCVALCAAHHHHHEGDVGGEVYTATVTE
jgi:hypothetical protein